MQEGLHGKVRSYALSSGEKKAAIEVLQSLLAGREEILFAYAHGSFLEEGPFRDLDVSVYVKSGDTDQAFRFTYEDSLAKEIMHRAGFHFPVDIRLLNGAPISFQYHVFRGRLLLDRDPDSRIEVVSNVIARYLDIKPVLRHHLREAFSSEPQS
jgi:predicted nucleotidyltransferase